MMMIRSLVSSSSKTTGRWAFATTAKSHSSCATATRTVASSSSSSFSTITPETAMMAESAATATATAGTTRNKNASVAAASTKREQKQPSSSQQMLYTSVTPLPPILPPPSPPLPLAVQQQTTKDGATNTTTTSMIKEKSWTQKLMERINPETQRQIIIRAESMFQAATRQASNPLWYGPGRIEREFRNKHALLTMHIWFLHKRLILDEIDKDTALTIQEELFNILWEDTTCRIRKYGVQELLVNKSLLQVQQYTFLHLTHYDHVYTELLDKPQERLNELRKLVWRHILVSDDDAEYRYDQIDRIVWYIEAQYQNIIMHWPDEYYRNAQIAWVNVPDFNNLRDVDGTFMKPNPINPDDVVPEPWLSNITLRGIEYYWNTKTLESTWEKPKPT